MGLVGLTNLFTAKSGSVLINLMSWRLTVISRNSLSSVPGVYTVVPSVRVTPGLGDVEIFALGWRVMPE